MQASYSSILAFLIGMALRFLDVPLIVHAVHILF